MKIERSLTTLAAERRRRKIEAQSAIDDAITLIAIAVVTAAACGAFGWL